MKISVCIPFVRPQNVARLEKWIFQRAGIPAGDIEVIFRQDTKRTGCPKTFNAAVRSCRHELVAFVGDDCEPQENFLREALLEMKKFDGAWGIVGFDCSYQRHFCPNVSYFKPAHFCAHKKMLEALGGEFMHQGYRHDGMAELALRARKVRRYRLATRAVIKHHHPVYAQNLRLWDEHYQRALAAIRHDQALFKKRAKDLDLPCHWAEHFVWENIYGWESRHPSDLARHPLEAMPAFRGFCKRWAGLLASAVAEPGAPFICP